MTFSVTNWTRLVMPGLFSFRCFGYLIGRLSRMLRRQPRPHRENGLWKIPLRPRIAFARFMEQSAQIAPARVWIRSFPLAGRAARWLHRNQTGWRDRSRMPVPLPARFRKRREARHWCIHQRTLWPGAILRQHRHNGCYPRFATGIARQDRTCLGRNGFQLAARSPRSRETLRSMVEKRL